MNNTLVKSDNEWVPVEDGLPLPEYHGQNVVGTYLVTVRLNNKDEHDDDEVCTSDFDFRDLTWRYTKNNNFKYLKNKDSGWHVIAWKFLPPAYISK